VISKYSPLTIALIYLFLLSLFRAIRWRWTPIFFFLFRFRLLMEVATPPVLSNPFPFRIARMAAFPFDRVGRAACRQTEGFSIFLFPLSSLRKNKPPSFSPLLWQSCNASKIPPAPSPQIGEGDVSPPIPSHKLNVFPVCPSSPPALSLLLSSLP